MRYTVLAGAGILLSMLAACGMNGPAHHEGTPPGVDAVVDMSSTLNFAPVSVTIPVGGTVEWRNAALMTHTVTADPALAEDAADVLLPDGADPFDSGDIPAGQVWRHSFETAGEYRYFCKPHEGYGMIGTVIVRQGG